MAETATPRELLEDVRSLLESGEYTKLVALVTSQHAADINELALELEDEVRQDLVSHLPADVVGQMLEFAEASELSALVRATPVAMLPQVLATVDDDVVADALQELDEDDREATLRGLDAEKDIQGLLEYEEQSAGGIMSRGFVALDESMSVQQAIDYLRAAQPSSTQTYYLYVVDSGQHLLGNLNIRDLLVSAPYTRLGDITNRDIHEVTTETDQEEAARLLQRYNLLAVPVVDDGGRMVGVTLAEDLIDVVREEATEDMYRIGRPGRAGDGQHGLLADHPAAVAVAGGEPLHGVPGRFRGDAVRIDPGTCRGAGRVHAGGGEPERRDRHADRHDRGTDAGDSRERYGSPRAGDPRAGRRAHQRVRSGARPWRGRRGPVHERDARGRAPGDDDAGERAGDAGGSAGAYRAASRRRRPGAGVQHLRDHGDGRDLVPDPAGDRGTGHRPALVVPG
ncbi:MAG: CBS domain-containing protein [Dehalococcoidia bacterium]|nr:CBS domain-containing protein [Dehalococcoidia bacterium]